MQYLITLIFEGLEQIFHTTHVSLPTQRFESDSRRNCNSSLKKSSVLMNIRSELLSGDIRGKTSSNKIKSPKHKKRAL